MLPLDVAARTDTIAVVADGSFLREESPIIRGDGYVVRTLEAALWAFSKSTCFEDGALLAVNLGEDADTAGAVYGQLAGTYYGVESIPERWRSWFSKSAHSWCQATPGLALSAPVDGRAKKQDLTPTR